MTRGDIRRQLEDIRSRVERTVEKPLHSPAWPYVVAHLNRRRAIRQGAETTPEELAEIERFDGALKTELKKRRAEGRIR